MTRAEKQREANYRWRMRNKEFLKIYQREKYLKNRDKILAKYREEHPPKPIVIPEPVKIIKPKRDLKLFEIIEILRKDLRHRLWGYCVREWTDKDWQQFNELRFRP